MAYFWTRRLAERGTRNLRRKTLDEILRQTAERTLPAKEVSEKLGSLRSEEKGGAPRGRLGTQPRSVRAGGGALRRARKTEQTGTLRRGRIPWRIGGANCSHQASTLTLPQSCLCCSARIVPLKSWGRRKLAGTRTHASGSAASLIRTLSRTRLSCSHTAGCGSQYASVRRGRVRPSPNRGPSARGCPANRGARCGLRPGR